MNDPLVWLIILAFYLPGHLLGPVGLSLWLTKASEERRQVIRLVLIEAVVIMALAFALALYWLNSHFMWSMYTLLISLLLPYPLVWIHSRNSQAY